MRNKFLTEFEKTINPRNSSSFCISFLFTYRDFHEGTAGLASVGKACSPRHNSGFVSFLNYGQDRDFTETSVTLMHEVAHTWGAHHDQDFTDRADCTNGSFIMNNVSLNTVPGTFFGTRDFIRMPLNSLVLWVLRGAGYIFLPNAMS